MSHAHMWHHLCREADDSATRHRRVRRHLQAYTAQHTQRPWCDRTSNRTQYRHATYVLHAQMRREMSAAGAGGSGACARVDRRHLARRSADNGGLRRACAAIATAARQPSAALGARRQRHCTPPLPAAAAVSVAPAPAAIACVDTMLEWAPARRKTRISDRLPWAAGPRCEAMGTST